MSTKQCASIVSVLFQFYFRFKSRFTLTASGEERNVRFGVRLSVCLSRRHTYRDSPACDQRTLRPDNKEDRHTCFWRYSSITQCRKWSMCSKHSAVSIKYRLLTDRQTDRHKTMPYTALCICVAYTSRGKTPILVLA